MLSLRRCNGGRLTVCPLARRDGSSPLPATGRSTASAVSLPENTGMPRLPWFLGGTWGTEPRKGTNRQTPPEKTPWATIGCA
jgi:hypothetical protein